ncbi:MAG: serine hydrolase [Blautia sp.]|nr:serine hydrolase [Blautia sp.]
MLAVGVGALLIQSSGFSAHSDYVFASDPWGADGGDVVAVAEPAAEATASAEGAAPAPAVQETAPAAADNNHPEPDPALTEGAEGAEQAEGTLKPSSGNSPKWENNSDESLDELMAQIQGNIPAGNGNWACYVCDLQGETEDSFNNAQMQSASLIKLYIMGAVYEKYDALAATYGADSLYSLLHSMIIVSSNEAANTLTTYLGGGDAAAGRAAVNAFCAEHGYVNTHMGRMLLASNEFDDNYTSVEDCGHFLREVYEVSNGTRTDSTLAHCNEMFDHLKAQECRNKIPAQMPAGVKVANKTGELGDVENDAGIIYDTGKKDIVIVFMAQNLSAVGTAQGVIASNSAAIYNYFNS